MDYDDFIASKLLRQPPTGLATVPNLGFGLFPHQRDLTSWALRRGRCAIFASTGLGKSRCEIVFARTIARHERRPSIIFTPCAVAPQMVTEGAKLDTDVILVRDGTDVDRNSANVYVTNYERLHRFDASAFGAVVCDESSCMKSFDSKTLRDLKVAFANTPSKLCGTATPAPNDWTELGTHAEFLGICTRQEMLAEYFVHDGGETQKWRLKGHARAAFWRWVASWGAMVTLPSDLGHDDTGYILPSLNLHEHVMDADAASVKATGLLFALPAKSLRERRSARKGTMDAKVSAIHQRIMADRERWVVWCELNAEQDDLADALGDECISIYGTLDLDEKEFRMAAFLAGERRVLITKPSIAGFGVNMQSAARMAFIGVTDSYESYFQAIRRCWRFGQTRPVDVHVYTSALEGAVLANLRRKEHDAEAMAKALAAETRDAVRAEIHGATRQTTPYDPKVPIVFPDWLVTQQETV
jgi:hypothetical protein